MRPRLVVYEADDGAIEVEVSCGPRRPDWFLSLLAVARLMQQTEGNASAAFAILDAVGAPRMEPPKATGVI
jgi:hypothetical protein